MDLASTQEPEVTIAGTGLDTYLAERDVATPTIPNVEIPNDVAQMLAELEMLSHGQTATIDPAPGARDNAARLYPPGEADPPHLALRARWLGAKSERARAAVRCAMRSELDAARGHGVDRSKVQVETAAQLARRIVREGEGLTADEASVRFRCTTTMVRRARLAGERDPELGRRLPSARNAQERVDRAEVHRLRAAGLSVRAIAMRTGVPRSTVHDWVTEAS